MTHQECNVEDLLNNKTNYRLIQHAENQIPAQSTTDYCNTTHLQ